MPRARKGEAKEANSDKFGNKPSVPNLPGMPGNTIGNRWKPGQSGNPAGRPRSSTELKQMAANQTDLAFEVHRLAAELTRMRLQAAVDMLSDPERRRQLTPDDLDSIGRVIDPAGLAAAAHIIDRGHGKPTQKVEAVRGGPFDDLDQAELAKWIADQLPEVARLLGKK